MRLFLITMIFFLSLSIYSGCSGSNPTLIPVDGNITNGVNGNFDSISVGVADRFPDGSPASGMGTLGLFHLSVDSINNIAEMASLRQTALTDVLEVVDITNFLQMAPCYDCARIGSVSLDADGNLVVSIGIKHPFPAGDLLKPISGKNRGDLHVFNIEGTIISNTAGSSFSGTGETIAGFTLVNADGYTGYLDSVLDAIYPTDATVHPYILHFDDYTAGNFDASNPMGFDSVTNPPPSGNLVMAMGCDYNYQDYVFDLSSGPMDFIYAVGCTYAVSSAGKGERFNPEYRIPQHNKKAASEISVVIITNDLKGEDTSSTADIEIRVVDISHDVATGSHLDEMFAQSNVDDVFIEIPNITSLPVVIDGNNSISGTGHDPTDPLVYEATITNTAGGVEGTYTGLVKITDTYAPGQNESALLNGMDGIKRVEPVENPLAGLFDISEFATYQTFSIYVATGNDLPVAVLVSDPDPADIDQFETVYFDATGSYDTDGSIVLYEFDWEWDGVPVNFIADDSNTTGLITSEPYANHGTFTTGLRVTDDLGGFGYDSVTVNVAEISVIFVDDSYVGPPYDGTQAHPYNTIQEGIDAAVDGDHVWVDDSGMPYNEEVLMKSGVTVFSYNWDDSDGGDRAFIDGPENNDTHSVYFYNVDNAVLKGFQIGFAGLCAGVYTEMLRVDGGSNNTITDCLFTGNTDRTGVIPIKAIGSQYLTIEHCRIAEIDKDTSSSGCLYFNGIDADNCPDLTVRNNIFTDIRSSADSSGKNIYPCYIKNSANVVVKNNLVHHITPDASVGFMGAIMISGFHFISCTNTEVINNTVDNLDSSKAFFIQNLVGYFFDSCSNPTFINNIVTHLDYSGFPPGNDCGVKALYEDLYCDYSCFYDMSQFFGSCPVCTAHEGIGCIFLDPDYNDPNNEDYDVSPTSPAQNGDPSIDDWDGNPGDGSRMGCHGGPGGETVGLLT